MHARTHTVASYVDDATMLRVGHIGSFKIPRTLRHFLPEGLSAQVWP